MIPSSALADELARLNVAELIIPEADIDESNSMATMLGEDFPISISKRPRHVFDPHLAKQNLCRHFGVAGMDGFGFDDFDASLCAAAAILDYLQETQKSALAHIVNIIPRHPEKNVLIDRVTLRSLEVERTLREGSRDGSLLNAVDMTVNPMGSRLLRDWLCFPLSDADSIRIRQNAVEDLRDHPDRLRRLRDLIREMGDIERIIARLGVGRATPRDLVALGAALLRCSTVAQVIGEELAKCPDTETDLLTECALSLHGHEEMGTFLSRALKEDAPPIAREGGFIADGYHAELDRLRALGHEGSRWLAEYQAKEAAHTGIATLKVGYNSVFGYYIEITHQHRDKIPVDYVRKQTIRNAERYITDELKKHETEVLGAQDRALQLELSLFDEIRDKVVSQLPSLRAASQAIAILDVLAGFAELARRRDYCRPEITETPKEENAETDQSSAWTVLEIIDGRHPVLDAAMGNRFVPNDCLLSIDGDRLIIITGPNMAGKSTYIRQVALLTLLAQTGSFVPAKSMRWSPVDRIFARVGASDELAKGHSTFMVEMVETSRILNNATSRSLVILDEIGRGTSTYDGLALAWAIAEYITDRLGCRTLFATHYHELTELADQLPGAANFNVAVKEELRPDGAGRDVVFLHKIVRGPADRSYGVHVAAMAGLPASVVKRGESILAELERSFSRKSRSKHLTASVKKDAAQLLLFGEGTSSFPNWWRDVVDCLGSLDLDHLTPMEALSVLKKLQGYLKQSG